ncbi:DUF7574 domain-containing protein [Brevibacterium permense]|uniref:DUF7574 domain-containing protein n=1 Tax=Brevibacterium permense TaxID=234834 RepID=A0ABN2A8K0_9MICO|nr:hypothetical protein [Brevibacterium permense]
MSNIERDTALSGEVMDPVQAHRKLRTGFASGLESDEEIPGLINVFDKDVGGYEWECFGAWYDGHRYHWFSDGGCSCYGPGQDIETLADMENGDEAALIRAYKTWAIDSYFLGNSDKVEAEAQIRAAIRAARR